MEREVRIDTWLISHVLINDDHNNHNNVKMPHLEFIQNGYIDNHPLYYNEEVGFDKIKSEIIKVKP